MKLISTLWIKIISLSVVALWGAYVEAAPVHGVSLYGEPKYPAGFESFDYVNPNAPKKGVLTQAGYAAFDTLNPFVINGISAPGVGLIYDTLMKASLDESFSLYGLIADSVDMDLVKKTVTFHINPNARFSDNSKITANDVLFSFNVLRDKGAPMYRAYYRDVVRAEALADDVVRFELSPESNRELPLILGELPVLSKKWWDGRDFTKTSLDIPVSSGPYVVEEIDPGRKIVYKRNPNYWAVDLNVNRGVYNFEKIVFDIYRDSTVAVEAFKAGLIDVRLENEAKKWNAFLSSDQVRNGEIKTKIFNHGLPAGMQGFVFNTRRDIFSDPRVREAIGYAFDFDWTNKNLFFNAYRRTESYFENSVFKAVELPDERERELLEQWKEHVPASVWDKVFKNPTHTGNIRWNLEKALNLLQEAGWRVENGLLVNKNGEPFRFEILLESSSVGTWQRVVLPFVKRLKRIGIQVVVYPVNAIQYKNRVDNFDYDMIVTVWGQSLSPGNEQRYFWGSGSADMPGSWNYSGIKNKAVDGLIEEIVRADNQADHITAVRALDRVLLHLYLVVPHWYTDIHRYLYWDKFGMPEQTPLKGTDPLLWWEKTS